MVASLSAMKSASGGARYFENDGDKAGAIATGLHRTRMQTPQTGRKKLMALCHKASLRQQAQINRAMVIRRVPVQTSFF